MKSAINLVMGRRLQIQDHANEIGITVEYISTLVDSFYEKVRQNSEIGPIFSRIPDEKWPIHLARMKDFWSSVCLNTGQYSGKPVVVHQNINGLEKEHFLIWLQLFDQCLKETAPSKEAASYIMEKANRISSSLQLALFPPDLGK